MALSGSGWECCSGTGTITLKTIQAALIERSALIASQAAVLAALAAIDLSGEWRCPTCSKDFASRQAMMVQRASEHGALRMTRRSIAGSTCPVCLRMYSNRSKVLDHVHEKSRVCYLNLMLWHGDLDGADIVAADDAQRTLEAASRARGETHTTTEPNLLGSAKDQCREF